MTPLTSLRDSERVHQTFFAVTYCIVTLFILDSKTALLSTVFQHFVVKLGLTE